MGRYSAALGPPPHRPQPSQRGRARPARRRGHASLTCPPISPFIDPVAVTAARRVVPAPVGFGQAYDGVTHVATRPGWVSKPPGSQRRLAGAGLSTTLYCCGCAGPSLESDGTRWPPGRIRRRSAARPSMSVFLASAVCTCAAIAAIAIVALVAVK